ncbi:MAG: ExsB family protein [Caldanaerobacter subterraneus]|uniref:ATP-dependent sacrificial sulfur transferase LarE n=1 Tax=unclassified Thermoanaerobacter TaxID=2636821 RepID=UPI0000E1D67F|nr:ATP-dependent sacrificial sulfur transferase LarE [Thermoanaerobacter sp. X514]ABY93491.1 ExsB family protein [Thermoanaerobacter sp. X514]KUK34640.1 MAG: ExsB family protein [Caldanaerobacter subterraneus]HCD09925.1 ATP-dependent sacrificial sulfur transferase LarE [Thermoanaerobacter sp.]
MRYTIGGVNIEIIKEKLRKLQEYLLKLDNALIAFSGGVDSTFLAKVSYDVLGNRVLAVTATSPMHPKSELKEAVELAKKIGIPHLVVEFNDILEIEEFRKNPLNRCYICKSNLFSRFKAIAEEKGFKYILEGTNADDVSDFRPGRRALKELGILSPLLECGIKKEEIRILSKELGLPTWGKPSYACLASRIPYGEEITYDKLSMVEKAEEDLRDLGFSGFRVRYHGDVARIELPKEQMETIFEEGIREEVVKRIKNAGFKYVTMDLEGYRTGSLNEPHVKVVKNVQ